MQNSITFHNRASIYTIGILILLMVLLYVLKWQLPTSTPVLKDDFMEVNLGNAEDGSGEIPVLREGVNAQAVENTINTPSKPSLTEAEEHTEEDQNIHEEVEVKKKKIVKKNPIKKIEPPKIIKQNKPVEKPTKKNIERPIESPAVKTKIETLPSPPKPKAVFKGLEGGNEATSSNALNSQGIGKATLGDMGKANGNVNATNYEGLGGSGGTQVKMSSDLIERGIVNIPKFEADFNQNAHLTIEIKVNENGNASFVRIIKTNTTNPQFLSIIKTKLQQLTFKPKDEESYGTIEFNFKLNR